VIERHSFSDEEIAVVTSSHGGEPEHRRCVAELLRRGGFTVADLRCGVHPPASAAERRRMLAAGEEPDALSNNCSGKHAGMLLHAARIGAETRGYLEIDHPVERAVESVLAEFLDLDLTERSTVATDGCGAPTWFAPIESIARAFARLGDRDFLAARGLAAAVDRMHGALRACPRLFSGDDRLPFLFEPCLAPTLFAKEGAEGVFVVWGSPGALAVKALDGSERGYRYALPSLLERLGWLPARALAQWRRIDPPVIRSVAGVEVGAIEVELPAGVAPAR
jgi:L-asparaginase II